jgi:hypothetical protein
MLLTFLDSKTAIAVGTPVTRRPPHRSRRAVFPHRALQQDSLPHSSSGPRGCLSPLWIPDDSWPFDFEALQYSHEALPVIAVPLASPVEPLQESTQRAIEELLEARTVPMHSVVLGIPSEFAVQLLKQPSEPPMAILLAPLGEALQSRTQSGPRRPALQRRLPRSVPPPAKLKPQELKTSLSCGLLATEGQDAGLLGRQRQPEFLPAGP